MTAACTLVAKVSRISSIQRLEPGRFNAVLLQNPLRWCRRLTWAPTDSLLRGLIRRRVIAFELPRSKDDKFTYDIGQLRIWLWRNVLSLEQYGLHCEGPYGLR